ncbi:hypothetical protein OEZ85_005593 [Tetradesmus obliquus]|uniref:Uncharacterized protein n=1 Tax=Tetradesmus obliquus TaxID=3088 RepID=A0ABY8UEG4_TETOB|nr:hypothetical protein OEZ85_005593 [Tetradesmus obliquus]
MSQLAQQLGGQPGSLYWLPAEMKAALAAVASLYWLPAEMKAALAAVARRRGELTSQVLAVLADAEWGQLDLAGCSQLNGAQLLALAPLMPNIRTLDVTGFDQLSAAGWRRLALDAAVALDEPLMQLVGPPAAWQVKPEPQAGSSSSVTQADGAESPTAGSLVGSRRELRASHVLRAPDAWVDEV